MNPTLNRNFTIEEFKKLNPVTLRSNKKKQSFSNSQLLSTHLADLSSQGRSVTQTFTGKESASERRQKKLKNQSLQPTTKVFHNDLSSKANSYPTLSPKDFKKMPIFMQRVNAANEKWRQDKISHRRMEKYLLAEPQSLFSMDLKVPELETLTTFLQEQAATLKDNSIFTEFIEFKNHALSGLDSLVFSMDQMCIINALIATLNCHTNPEPHNAVYLGFSVFWIYLQFGSRLTKIGIDIGSQAMKWISRVTNVPTDTVEPQIDIEDIAEYSTISTCLLGLWTNMYVPFSKLPKTLWDELSSFDRVKGSLSSIMTSVFTKIQALMEHIAGYFETVSPFAFITSNEDRYKEAISTARALAETHTAGRMIFDDHTFEAVSRATFDIEDLLLKIPRQRESVPMVELLKQVETSIKKVYIDFLAKNFAMSGYRQEPVSCMFYGKPGMGKSNLINSLTGAVVGSFLSEAEIAAYKRDSTQQLYNRQAETKYWDGYNAQFVTNFDDLGQMKDIAGNPDNEWMNAIRAINSFEYRLHMAELHKKGTTFFRSKFVFATTNLQQFKPTSIISADAFNRRWDFQYEVDLKPEYSLKSSGAQLDVAHINWKAARADGITGMSPNLLRFKNKDGTGDFLSFEEIVELLSDKYKEKSGWHDTNQGVFDDYTDKYYRARLAAEAQSGSSKARRFTPGSDSFSFDVLNEFSLVNSMKLAKAAEHPIYTRIKQFVNYLDLNKILISTLAFLGGVLLAKLIKVFLVPKVIDAWKYLSGFFFSHNPENESQVKQLAKVARKSNKIKTRLVQSQSGSPSANFAERLLEKNVVEIYFTRPGGKPIRLGTGLFVEGKNLLIPKHFAKQLLSEILKPDVDTEEVCLFDTKADASSYFVNVGPYKMSVIDFLSGSLDDDALAENDLALMHLPGPIPSARNVVDNFISMDELNALPKSNHVTFQKKCEGKVHVTYTFGAKVDRVPVTDPNLGDYELLRAWKYNAMTQKGDCGSVLLTNFTSANKAYILGLHVAGVPRLEHGFGGLVVKEDIVRCLQESKAIFGGPQPIDERHIDNSALPQSSLLPDDSDMVYLGSSNTRMYAPSKSRFVKSLLYDPETSTKAPALLTPRGALDPYRQAIAKYIAPKPYLSPDTVGIFGTCAYRTIQVLLRGSDYAGVFKPMSFEDAILGISPFGDLKSITRSTSAGFPYNCDPSISTQKKRYFFGDGEDFNFATSAAQELKRTVLDQMKMLAAGITPNWVFVDSLKDELRDQDKVDAGKTRMISIAPIELIIVSRMLFGHLMAHCTRHRIGNGFATGVNPYDPAEWNSIREHLAEVRPSRDDVKVGAGDFSGFDASEHPYLLNEIFEALGEFYKVEHQNHAISSFARSITNSTHMFQNHFYSWFGSMPSGHPLTTFVNNIFNISAFRFCFDSVCPDVRFEDHIRIVVQGDDNLWSVSSRYQSVFTELVVADEMVALGLNYTSDTKGDFSGEWRDITEVQFLKRKFVPFHSQDFPGIWIAPLALDTLVNMPMWKEYDIISDILNVLELEWALHGKKAYETNFVYLVSKFRDVYAEYCPIRTHLPWKIAFAKALSSDLAY